MLPCSSVADSAAVSVVKMPPGMTRQAAQECSYCFIAPLPLVMLIYSEGGSNVSSSTEARRLLVKSRTAPVFREVTSAED